MGIYELVDPSLDFFGGLGAQPPSGNFDQKLMFNPFPSRLTPAQGKKTCIDSPASTTVGRDPSVWMVAVDVTKARITAAAEVFAQADSSADVVASGFYGAPVSIARLHAEDAGLAVQGASFAPNIHDEAPITGRKCSPYCPLII